MMIILINFAVEVCGGGDGVLGDGIPIDSYYDGVFSELLIYISRNAPACPASLGPQGPRGPGGPSAA